MTAREIPALIDTLHATEQRLEALTDGQVDSVSDRRGRPMLLRRAQDHLRASDAARQASILDALPASIALLDLTGSVAAVNEAWRRSAEVDAEQAPGRGIGVDFIGTWERDRGPGSAEAREGAAGIRAVLGGESKGYSIDYATHSPVQRRWFTMTVTPLDESQPGGVVVMQVDITDRRRDGEELGHLASAMDAVSDGIYLIDRASMSFAYVNDAACRMQNRTRAQLLALRPEEVMRVSRAELEQTYDAVIAGGVIAAPFEIERTRDGGERVRVELRRHALRTGDRWMIVTLVRDVTERNRAAEVLRRSEGLTAAILEASLDCLVTIDHEGLIVEFNPAAVATFGWTREQALGKSMVDLIVSPALRDAHRRGVAHYLATGEGPILGKRLELSAMRADGSEFPIELTIAALAGTPRPMFAAFIRDLTLRDEADAKLRRLNRVYAMLSGINALIVRVRDRDELFRDACRIAVEQGGFRMAWIGLLESAGTVVKPMASAGNVGDFFETAPLHAAAWKAGSQSLVWRAIGAGEPAISNDVRADPRVWRKHEMDVRGIRSLAAIPLMAGGVAIGVLTLYAPEATYFDGEETRLLVDLAGNISFALDHIERVAKLERVTRVNAMLSDTNAAIVRIRDRQELFEETCRIAVEAGGLRIAILNIVDESGMRLRRAATAGADMQLLARVCPRDSLRDDAPEGYGLGTRSVREGRAIVVNDVQADPLIRSKGAHAEGGINSIAALPLLVAGRAIGTYTLHAAEAGFFDDDEMKLLYEFVANVAFALENIDKEKKVRRLTRVHAMSSAISSLVVRVRDSVELFQDACRIAVEQGGFLVAWIAILDKQTGALEPIAFAGDVGDFFATHKLGSSHNSPLGPGLPGRAIRERQPMIANDVRNDPGILRKAALASRGVNSAAHIPLVARGEAIGVFALYAADAGFFDDEEVQLLQGLCSDISFAVDSIEKESRLNYLGSYDVLTGLANRSLFLERVAQYLLSAPLAGCTPALFLIDLERFKDINDSFGRAEGDALLRQVAAWLAVNAGEPIQLARVGPDLFGLVLPDVKTEGEVAKFLEETTRALLAHSFRVKHSEFRIAAKIGVALFPADAADADTLFMNAEAALKKAKSSGDRYLFYAQRMTESVAGRLALENQLRQALANDEFVLHYQPKVSLATGRLTGVEALIRWNDPRAGLVPPGRFIPVLEESGLIYDVGRWALRTAIGDYLRWRSAGLPAIRVAVNVSPLQLRNPGFLAQIGEAIGIDARAGLGLELEITESVIMEDAARSIATLEAIRAMGVTIAIDDFGTGFSSLSYLSRLPVDTLKIDRSFVVDMTATSVGLALVSTIVALAHSLKLRVVAEGVETEEQARLLRVLNCDEMQGYLVSKPVPAESFEREFLASVQPPVAA